MKHTPSQSGFTLVEMAIVLMTIGLILGGVLAGQTIISSSQIKAYATELEQHRGAFQLFTQKFRAYPGDFPRANSVLQVTSGGPGNDGNGDGDGRVEWPIGEAVLAWQHLEMANLVDGNFLATGEYINAIPGENIPRTKPQIGAGYFFNFSDNDLQNHIGIGFPDGSGINDTPALTPQEAFSLDQQLDDSLPSLGAVQSTGAGCINSGIYDLTNDDAVACLLMMRVDE